MKYGLPYQGSKSKLAELIVSLFPNATHFYDLFAGGCAISHAAMLSGKFRCVHFNDLNDSVYLFKDCIEGKIPDGSEWISREEFFLRKDSDPYVRLVWSFGNNQRDYLYSREIEPYKKLVHEMLYSPAPLERRLKFKQICKSFIESPDYRGDLPNSERSERLLMIYKHLQSSETFGRIKGLSQCFSDLKFKVGAPVFYEATTLDYSSIYIEPKSVIYCDIPYSNTKGYVGGKFNHEKFYDWCSRQTSICFISEYSMPESRFSCVAEFERTSTYSSTNNNLKKTERVFIPNHQAALYKSLMNDKLAIKPN